MAITKSGTTALIGRSNVGKSTLLNAALQLPLAIISRKPQTTRNRLLGVVRHGDAEIALLDTPGIHHARSRLGKEMNKSARGAAKEADVIAFVVGMPRKPPRSGITPHEGDLRLLSQIAADVPVVLVINKIDLLQDKRQLLPLIAAFSEKRELAAVVPVSALREDGITRVLDEIAKLLPTGDPQHDEETVTNRPMRWFAAEYVREPILRATGEEVPHAVAVTIDEFEEPPEGTVRIAATIHVERDGQKRIIIGDKGSMLKRIGTAARKRTEELMGRKVYLELFVRVTEGWRERPGQLADFGLSGGASA